MVNYEIAVLPGDGIGPDVVAEGLKVLRAVEAKLDGVTFSTVEFAVGAGEYLRKWGPVTGSDLR
jgi:isocitrate/isopropylmalate dehydrogenase